MSDTNELRLQQLERSNRRMKSCMMAMLGGLVLFAMIGMRPAQPSPIDTTRLRLLDSDGKPRAALVMTDDGPQLQLVDKQGRSRALLALSEAGPGLWFWNEKNEATLTMRSTEGGSLLGIGNSRKGNIGFVTTLQSAGFSVGDPQGKQRFAVFVDGDAAMLSFIDSKVRERISISDKPSGSSMVIKDTEKELWRAP